MKALETAVGAAFPPTRFSTVKIPSETWLLTKILTKKVHGSGGGQNSILTQVQMSHQAEGVLQNGGSPRQEKIAVVGLLVVIHIICVHLSGTESAILIRESSDSESCDLNCAIPRSRCKH